jgi:hypothetical protein
MLELQSQVEETVHLYMVEAAARCPPSIELKSI